MDAKVDAILHYIGDWIDDNYGERVEDCAENLTEMIKKIGEVRTMEGKAVKEIQAKMKTWTDAGIELAYNSGYEQGKEDAFTYIEQAEELAYQRGLEVNKNNFRKVCEALDDICNHECCSYGHDEACDIAEDYLEQLKGEDNNGKVDI